MADVLSSIKASIEAIKKLLALDEKVRMSDMRGLLLEAQERMLDAKTEVLELREENLRLKEELKALEELPSVDDNLELKGELYWMITPPKGRSSGPYCRKCYDMEGILMLVNENNIHFKVFGTYQCPKCKTNYK